MTTETLEAPVEKTIVPPVSSNNPVIDRLAEKSELKIQANQKVQQERKDASAIKPAAVAQPNSETVDTLQKATDIIADEPKKGTEQLTAEQQAQADIEKNNLAIEAERKAKETAGLEKKVETLEAKVVEAVIEPNHWEVDDNTGADASKTSENEGVKKTEDSTGELVKKYKTQAEEYENLVADPLISAILSGKKAGKDVSTILNDIKGEDIKSLTDEQVWQKELKSANLTEDEITSEMESFKELSPYQKKKQAEPIRAKLQTEQEGRLKQYASGNSAAAANTQIVAQKFITEKEQYLNSKKGKVEMGLEMTPARLQEISDYVDNFNLQRPDGSVDVARIARLGILEKNHKLLLQNAYIKGENDKAIKLMKEMARPSREDGAIKILPETTSAAKKDVESFRKELRPN
jgi:hypothetical protein